MNDPAIQAAIIAGIVALIVAILSQVVSIVNQILTHRLAQRRENEKYYNDVYQKLFAPAISDVFLYIDMVTNFRRGHDTSEEQEIEVKDKAISYIEDHLVYGSPSLVSSYHQIHSWRISDQSALNPSPPELQFLHHFAEEYVHVVKESSIFSGRKEREQLAPIYRRLILFLLYINGYQSLASHYWKFDESEYTLSNYLKIKAMLQKQKSLEKKTRSQTNTARYRLQKQLEGKSQEEQIAVMNQAMPKQYARQAKANDKFRTKFVNRVLKLMTKDKTEREEVEGWITKQEEYLKQPLVSAFDDELA